jgi:hypothetical protein
MTPETWTEVDPLVCVNCKKEFENGVVIDSSLYCVACAMSPDAIQKAQEAFLRGQKK